MNFKQFKIDYNCFNEIISSLLTIIINNYADIVHIYVNLKYYLWGSSKPDI